jgi:hypothetical protein
VASAGGMATGCRAQHRADRRPLPQGHRPGEGALMGLRVGGWDGVVQVGWACRGKIPGPRNRSLTFAWPRPFQGTWRETRAAKQRHFDRSIVVLLIMRCQADGLPAKLTGMGRTGHSLPDCQRSRRDHSDLRKDEGLMNEGPCEVLPPRKFQIFLVSDVPVWPSIGLRHRRGQRLARRYSSSRTEAPAACQCPMENKRNQ